jgi:thiol-disulfide isomerase/thioredoxin
MTKWMWIGLALVFVAGCAREDFRWSDGSPGRYADWAGKWVIVNYWAEWCAPCREEIPELNAMMRERSDLMVVGVNFDGLEGEALATLVAKMGIEFPVMVGSPRAAFPHPMPEVLPSSLIISPEGALVRTLVGPQTREQFEAALASAAAAQ